jgi:hypothetical protein
VSGSLRRCGYHERRAIRSCFCAHTGDAATRIRMLARGARFSETWRALEAVRCVRRAANALSSWHNRPNQTPPLATRKGDKSIGVNWQSTVVVNSASVRLCGTNKAVTATGETQVRRVYLDTNAMDQAWPALSVKVQNACCLQLGAREL